VGACVGLLALAPGAAPAPSGGGSPAEPTVSLRLRASGALADGGAAVTLAGTFRGRVVAGRRTQVLLPVGRVIATHRHGTAPAQRARIDRLFLDGRSGSAYLRIFATGTLIGGPAIVGPDGPCRRVAVRHLARLEARTAVLRWACRRAAADRGPAIHRDVFTRPGDTLASTYTIIERPCSRPQARGASSSTTSPVRSCHQAANARRWQASSPSR
jgi:hypothetical protein